MCVCVRDRVTSQHISYLVAAFVYVCVRERERVTSQQSVQPSEIVLIAALCVSEWVSEREREREWEREWERERERQCHITAECTAIRNSLNRSLCANTYKHHHCVCHANLFPSRAWTDGKTKDIINGLYFNFESWSSRLWKGALHFRRGLWCSPNHNAPGQLANQSRLRLLEGGTL